MKQIFKPREYQKLIISHIIKTPRCAVFAGMGMGKTVSTLFAIDYLQKIEGAGGALILAPLRVAASTWPGECDKWQGLGVNVIPIIGTPKDRIKAINTPANAYSINYDNLPWICEYFGDNWPFDIIVADESTRLKSFRLGGGGSKRAKCLSKVAWRASRFIELTGTPAPNGLLDLWGQIYFLDRGARLGRSMTAYQSRYFRAKKVGRSPFAVKWEPCEFSPQRIHEKLLDLCISLDAADYFPIDTPINVQIPVSLPPAAQSVYKELQKEMFAKLGSGEIIEAMNAAAMTVKCLQLASGAVYTDGGKYEYIHDEKIEALKSIIEEAAGAPVLVAYHWKFDAELILKAIPGARLLDKSPQTIKDWNAGKIPVMLAHPASAGHGLNLQDGGNILVFYSHWWDLEQYQQIVERIGPTRQFQAGHPRPVFIYHIIAADTVDGLVMKRRESKRSIQDILLEALKKA